MVFVSAAQRLPQGAPPGKPPKAPPGSPQEFNASVIRSWYPWTVCRLGNRLKSYRKICLKIAFSINSTQWILWLPHQEKGREGGAVIATRSFGIRWSMTEKLTATQNQCHVLKQLIRSAFQARGGTLAPSNKWSIPHLCTRRVWNHPEITRLLQHMDLLLS